MRLTSCPLARRIHGLAGALYTAWTVLSELAAIELRSRLSSLLP